MRFEAVMSGRTNNLNLLRMVAATTVLFSHSYALTGRLAEEPVAMATSGRTDAATIGVVVFFAISGFLIAQSLTRSRSLSTYAVNRVLRIVPGLALATVFCVVAVGWTTTTLATGDYWRHAGTWRFLLGTPVLRLHDRLPGVFAQNPFPGAIDGSLWTIPVEAWCYVAAALTAAVGLLQRRWLFSLFTATALVAYAWFPAVLHAGMPGGGSGVVPRLIGTFLLGAWIFTHRRFVPVSIGLAAAALTLPVWAAGTPYFGYAYYGTIAYVALVFAYHPRLLLRGYLVLGDYSYGTYVLAFPVQQFIVWRFQLTQPLVLFALAFVCTLPLATLSWHVVEKPALALKRRAGEAIERWSVPANGRVWDPR